MIHGWEDGPASHFWPWLRSQFQNQEIEIIQPQMPDTNVPIIDKWVSHLSELVGTVDENTYFVGHSIGCQTIMRYLDSQDNKSGGSVFVAGWFNLENLENEDIKEIAKPWLNDPINFDHIKNLINPLKVFLSSDEIFGCVQENKKIFEEKLGAEVVILNERGHFTSKEMPEALSVLKEIIK